MGAVDAPTDLAPDSGLHSLHRRLDKLSDRHPSSPRYGQDNRAADVRPLTDAEHAEHVTFVRTRLDEARKAGLETHLTFTIDDRHEVWAQDRRMIHDDLVEELYSRASDVPNDRTAIVTGGLAGAGKTTVLTQHAGIELSHYLMVNPDLIKEEMAARGLVPDVDGLSPMEASELVHEECSHLAKRLAHRAQSEGKNLIWDITMSRAASAEERIESMRAAGYKQVDGIFVDISVDVSLRRADSRHREGHDQFLAGCGLGGRFVPPETIVNQADDAWGSKNRSNFESVKSQFDNWAHYDNSVDGRPARLIEGSR
jgi:predicted ABC-type ATPase